MKFDLSDFQSTQIKIPTIEDVCQRQFFDPASAATSAMKKATGSSNLSTNPLDVGALNDSSQTSSKAVCFCSGCGQVCGIDTVLKDHINEKKLVYMCKDIAMHSYIAVHYLHEISKLLNQENKLKQIDYFQVDFPNDSDMPGSSAHGNQVFNSLDASTELESQSSGMQDGGGARP